MAGFFYLCNDDETNMIISFTQNGPVVKQGHFFEIQFKADLRAVNGKDDTLYQNHFRDRVHRIFKQGRERLATTARVGVFRNY